MLFLTFIKGPLMANWMSVMNQHLNMQVWSGVPVRAKLLWDHVHNSFWQQYTDMQEWESAEDTLQRGIQMKGGNLDEYIVEYEVLIEMAGYDPNSRLALKIFTDSLPVELYKDIVRLDQPCNFNKWKTAALEQQAKWVHFKHQSKQKKRVRLFNPFKTTYQPTHDPNTMDTVADWERVWLAKAEENEQIQVHEEGNPNREGNLCEWWRHCDKRPGKLSGQPSFPPRDRFLQWRWEQMDKQGVLCYNCQQYQHITKFCHQPKKGQSSQVHIAKKKMMTKPRSMPTCTSRRWVKRVKRSRTSLLAWCGRGRIFRGPEPNGLDEGTLL